MSILETIIEQGLDFDIRGYDLDRRGGLPELKIRAYIIVPASLFSEDVWLGLDGGFKDPETGSSYYCYDFDEDDEKRWATMAIVLKGRDVPPVIEILKNDLDRLLDTVDALT